VKGKESHRFQTAEELEGEETPVKAKREGSKEKGVENFMLSWSV